MGMFGGDDGEVHELASAGEVEQLKSLLEKNPELINAEGWHNRTPLHCAAQHGHVDCVRLLIERGADVNARCLLTSVTPLFDAVSSPIYDASPSDALACAQLLLEHGADTNVKSPNRSETAIFHVQSLDTLLLLAKYGADLDAVSDENQYPFEYHAYYVGDPALLNFWLKRGVDVNHVPGFTEPVLNGVVSHLCRDERNEEEKFNQIQQLLDYGANPNLGESLFGNSPLHTAASKGRADIARLLLEGGADPNFQNHYKETPLHAAVKEGHIELVKLLVERGADVNTKNASKRSPWDLVQDSTELRPILEPLGRDVPDMHPTPEQLVERLLALPEFSEDDLLPCSENDLDIMGRLFDFIFPESYIKFLRLMGRGAGGFLETDHWDAFFPALLKIGQQEQYADYCRDLPEHYFVFASRLGAVHHFFIEDETDMDDPPVYSFGDGYDGTFRKTYNSFWDFFEEMVIYYEIHSKRG